MIQASLLQISLQFVYFDDNLKAKNSYQFLPLLGCMTGGPQKYFLYFFNSLLKLHFKFLTLFISPKFTFLQPFLVTISWQILSLQNSQLSKIDFAVPFNVTVSNFQTDPKEFKEFQANVQLKV